MTDQETALLEKANRLYPPGTVYTTAALYGDKVLRTAEESAYFHSKDRIAVASGGGLVYCEGRWADIVNPVTSARAPIDNYLTFN